MLEEDKCFYCSSEDTIEHQLFICIESKKKMGKVKEMAGRKSRSWF